MSRRERDWISHRARRANSPGYINFPSIRPTVLRGLTGRLYVAFIPLERDYKFDTRNLKTRSPTWNARGETKDSPSTVFSTLFSFGAAWVSARVWSTLRRSSGASRAEESISRAFTAFVSGPSLADDYFCVPRRRHGTDFASSVSIYLRTMSNYVKKKKKTVSTDEAYNADRHKWNINRFSTRSCLKKKKTVLGKQIASST